MLPRVLDGIAGSQFQDVETTKKKDRWEAFEEAKSGYSSRGRGVRGNFLGLRHTSRCLI
jgi:hypothetical protein